MDKQSEQQGDNWDWDVGLPIDNAQQEVSDIEIRSNVETIPSKSPMLSKSKQNSANNLSQANGIKSSPSFQELEVFYSLLF